MEYMEYISDISKEMCLKFVFFKTKKYCSQIIATHYNNQPGNWKPSVRDKGLTILYKSSVNLKYNAF